jgi:transcriptional regulator with XRE-family HTH domain
MAGTRTLSLDRPPVRQRIGPTIKALRVQQGLSLNALAAAAGISPSHLSRIERGLTVPSYDVLDRVADAIGSDLRELRAEEESARAVDGELDVIFDNLGLDATARADLLRLSHQTRADLARAFKSLQAQGAAAAGKDGKGKAKGGR